MNELVQISKNGAVVSSRQVSEHFGKRHDHVIRDIEELGKDVPKIGEMFYETKIADSYGRKQKAYIMNRDGFSLLVMGFTGKKALEWKLKYIEAFNAMEKLVYERQSIAWQETRQSGKLTRKAETDVIKDLVEYAKEQGSKNSQMLYMTYSKLAKNAIAVSDRDIASTLQLTKLTVIEDMILQAIRLGMEQDKGYKEIYQDCKARVEQFKDITFIKLQQGEKS
ncbi:MAG: Rha family transcriptional regulator [Selenomonadaceae bacterium]